MAACANLPLLHGSPEIMCATPKKTPTKTIMAIAFQLLAICKFACGFQSEAKKNFNEDL